MEKNLQLYSIDRENNNIEFDRDFFYRLFIQVPIKTNKPLTSLSLRLAALLLEYLSMFQYRKLPQRKLLSSKLKVSQQAIIDSLIQLEQVGLLQRRVNELENVVFANEEEGKRLKDQYERTKEEARKTRRFSDEFIINYNYNMTKEEIDKDILRIIENTLTINGVGCVDIESIIKNLNNRNK